VVTGPRRRSGSARPSSDSAPGRPRARQWGRDPLVGGGLARQGLGLGEAGERLAYGAALFGAFAFVAWPAG
jgi:hypothetical protein